MPDIESIKKKLLDGIKKCKDIPVSEKLFCEMKKYKNMLFPEKKEDRKRNLLILALLFLLSAYIGGILARLSKPDYNGIGLGPLKTLQAAVLTAGGRFATFMVMLALMVAIIFLLYKMREDSNEDERGFHYAKSGEYGTSRFANRRECEEFLEFVDSAEETTGIIVGRSLEDGKIAAIPADSPYNRNIFGIGSQGTNKSIAFVRNMIIQCAIRGESIIVTDPKSELFRDMVYYLKKQGYDVVQWNTVNRWNSNGWDVLQEIRGEEELEYIDVIVGTIIKNSNEGQETGDKYFEDIDYNLLKALILYVLLEFPKEKQTLGQVYNLLMTEDPDSLDIKMDALDVSHPAKGSYNLLRGKAKDQAWTGLGTRLKIFQSQVIQNITGHEEINIDAVARRKTAVFCIVSDSNTTYNMLNALFISTLFIKLFAYADMQENGKCDLPVHLILDEFPNIGFIDAFKQKEGTARSRDIGIDILIQNWPQLMDRYGENGASEIIGGCDFRLFLGCNETVTSDLISTLTGIGTIDVETERRTFKTLRLTDFTPEFMENYGVGKRNVMLEDEVRRLDSDELLLFVRGQKPVKLRKFKYYEHPESLICRSIGATEVLPKWRLDEKGIDLRTGEPGVSLERLIEQVEMDDSRLIVKDSKRWGPQRTKLIKEMRSIRAKYAKDAQFPNGQPFFHENGHAFSQEDVEELYLNRNLKKQEMDNDKFSDMFSGFKKNADTKEEIQKEYESDFDAQDYIRRNDLEQDVKKSDKKKEKCTSSNTADKKNMENDDVLSGNGCKSKNEDVNEKSPVEEKEDNLLMNLICEVGNFEEDDAPFGDDTSFVSDADASFGSGKSLKNDADLLGDEKLFKPLNPIQVAEMKAETIMEPVPETEPGEIELKAVKMKPETVAELENTEMKPEIKPELKPEVKLDKKETRSQDRSDNQEMADLLNSISVQNAASISAKEKPVQEKRKDVKKKMQTSRNVYKAGSSELFTAMGNKKK